LKNKKTNTLTFKLWVYFVSFAVALFIILWFMQVIFLQSYYSSMKKSETISLALEIEEKINDDDIKDVIDKIAYKNALSIWVFDTDNNLIYSSNNSSGQGTITQLPTRPLSIDTTGIVDKILESSNQKVSYTLKIDRFKTELFVYGKVIPDTNLCLVLVSSIDPIDATTSVLQSQLVYVTIIALLISSIISVFLSIRISKPITDMTISAQKLAKGNYNVKFEKAGYKEMDDLADTLNFTASEFSKTDKIRKELIANVSHDLRTPLTMIKAYSEMIRDLSGDNKEKREEHLQVIIDETDRLTRLVNDMMDLSKIESGFATLTKEKFNYTEVLEKTIENFKVLHQVENCKITLETPKDLYVVADKTKIERVLYNLISNAINHSGDIDNMKNIIVKASVNGKIVRTEVIDNGVGIKKEDIAHIWDRYYKVNKNFKRSDTGSGLGLSIVKDILIAHNVNYGVNSEVGKGTDFWLDLERSSKSKESKEKNKNKEDINNEKESKE